jgi:hypothetical protein
MKIIQSINLGYRNHTNTDTINKPNFPSPIIFTLSLNLSSSPLN